MFEKLRQFIDDGRNMLEDAFVVPDDENFVAVPPGVTEEQLIEEAKQYVDAIIVEHHHEHHQNLVGVALDNEPADIPDTGTVPENESESDPEKTDSDIENDQQ